MEMKVVVVQYPLNSKPHFKISIVFVYKLGPCWTLDENMLTIVRVVHRTIKGRNLKNGIK